MSLFKTSWEVKVFLHPMKHLCICTVRENKNRHLPETIQICAHYLLRLVFIHIISVLFTSWQYSNAAMQFTQFL